MDISKKNIYNFPIELKDDNSEEARLFYENVNTMHLNKHLQQVFSGDRVFNFNSKGYNHLYILNTILEKEKIYTLVVDKLANLNFLSVNCSIILKAGNMNNAKASLRYFERNAKNEIISDPVLNYGAPLDRYDRFIYKINEYFQNGDLSVLSHSTNPNLNTLILYLASFDDIYHFCSEVYNLVDVKGQPDTKLINKIMKCGNKPLNNSENIYEYISCAIEFWNCRIRYIKASTNTKYMDEIDIGDIIYRII